MTRDEIIAAATAAAQRDLQTALAALPGFTPEGQEAVDALARDGHVRIVLDDGTDAFEVEFRAPAAIGNPGAAAAFLTTCCVEIGAQLMGVAPTPGKPVPRIDMSDDGRVMTATLLGYAKTVTCTVGFRAPMQLTV